MTAVAVVTPSSGSNSAAVLLFWVVGADTCPSLVVARGPRGRRALSSLWRSPPTDPVRPVFDRSAREGNAPRKGAGCPGATTEDRTVMRTTAGRRLSCGGCRTREGTVRADGPLDVLAAQAEPLDERAGAGDVGLRQVVQQAAAPPDQQEQAPPAVVVVLVLLEVLGEVADPTGQHRDLDLRRAGVVLDRRVVGHDLLLDSTLERHGRPPGQVTCGPRSGSRGQAAHTPGSPASFPRYQRVDQRLGAVTRPGGHRAGRASSSRRRPSRR